MILYIEPSISEGPLGRQLVTGSARWKSATFFWKRASAFGRKMLSSLGSWITLKRYAFPAAVCHTPDKSGLPSGVRGTGAVRFGFPSAVRGIPGVGKLSH